MGIVFDKTRLMQITHKTLTQYTLMQNAIKAPIGVLRSSWRSEVFKKPKLAGTTIKKSMSRRETPVVKVRGGFVGIANHSGYQY